MPGFAVRTAVRRSWARSGDRRGLALLVIVFAIVVVAAVVSVGYLVAGQQFRVGVGGGQGNQAFYAAEAGLSAGLSGWDSALAALEPGATKHLTSGVLSSGAAFEVRLTRIDAGLDENVALYLMVSTGRARGPWGGRRQVALFLRALGPEGLCCAAAVATRGDLAVSEAAVISGFDRVPEAWASDPGICKAVSKRSGAGVAFYGEGSLTETPGAAVVGLPATQRHPVDRQDLFASADRWFADLAGLADLRVSDAILERIEPVVGPEQTCDRTPSRNFGAPLTPSHPCFSYAPIIHAPGDLHIAAPGSGQGVLLVEGDLVIDAGFQFYGVVLVRGALRLAGQDSRLYGAVIVFNAGSEGSEVTSGARIDLSSCPLTRTLRGPKLYLLHPLAEFAWLEILE